MIVAQKIRNESFPNEKSLYDMKHRRNSTMSYKSRKPDNNTKPASSQKTGTNDDSYKSRKPDNNTKPASSQKTGTNKPKMKGTYSKPETKENEERQNTFKELIRKTHKGQFKPSNFSKFFKGSWKKKTVSVFKSFGPLKALDFMNNLPMEFENAVNVLKSKNKNKPKNEEVFKIIKENLEQKEHEITVEKTFLSGATEVKQYKTVDEFYADKEFLHRLPGESLKIAAPAVYSYDDNFVKFYTAVAGEGQIVKDNEPEFLEVLLDNYLQSMNFNELLTMATAADLELRGKMVQDILIPKRINKLREAIKSHVISKSLSFNILQNSFVQLSKELQSRETTPMRYLLCKLDKSQMQTIFELCNITVPKENTDIGIVDLLCFNNLIWKSFYVLLLPGTSYKTWQVELGRIL